MAGLLYATDYRINDYIRIVIPTVGQILDNEDAYYAALGAIVATPYDYMVQLDDIGIDFSTINDYELFMLLFNGLKSMDTSLIFGDLDLSGFSAAVNKENDMPCMVNFETGAVIDRGIYTKICKVLCQINEIKRVNKDPGNEAAKKYMIERARRKQKRAAKKPKRSFLEDSITALVNTEQFKYDYESVKNITIYQFNSSLHQIMHKIDFDNLMIGVYAGTVSTKDISSDKLNWIYQKEDY